MAEPIDLLFGLWTRMGPSKDVLHGDAHWRNLTNTTEASVCGGCAAFLSNYFDQLFILELIYSVLCN